MVGDLLTDVVVTAAEFRSRGTDATSSIVQRGGGSAANVAVWLAETGVADVTFAGRVGADPAGDVACRLLVDAGVQTVVARDPGRATGTCVVLVGADGERDMFTDPGASTALDPADVPDPAGFDRVHLSGYTLLHAGSRAAAVALITTARTTGVPVTVDPASAAPLRAVGPAAFRELVSGVDLLVPNADEARALTGSDDPVQAARDLLTQAAQVVVTLGGGGAVHVDRSGTVTRADAAPPPGPVVDSTGAGDAFVAGWTAAALTGADVSGCLAAATRSGAAAVTVRGGRPTDPAR